MAISADTRRVVIFVSKEQEQRIKEIAAQQPNRRDRKISVAARMLLEQGLDAFFSPVCSPLQSSDVYREQESNQAA